MVLPERSRLTYLLDAPRSAVLIVENSSVLLTFNFIVWGLEALFTGRVAKYEANSAGVDEPVTGTLELLITSVPPESPITEFQPVVAATLKVIV
jgi:hypothetical protein